MALRPAPGEPAPLFVARTPAREDFHFATVAGRPIVLAFLGSAGAPAAQALLAGLLSRRDLFDDRRASLFLVSGDPEDERAQRLRQWLPGVRPFWDSDGRIAALYGATDAPAVVVLDENLRGLRRFAAGPDGMLEAAPVADFIAALPPLPEGPAAPQAPVLLLPRVFEPELCRALIGYYRRHGGEDSGYMRESADGMIRGVINHAFKRRDDCLIEHEALRRAVRERIVRRVVPEIRKAFRFEATRIERYLLACYDGVRGGFFRAHRDNDGDGHRQFAVTINLNAEDYDGGDLRFPEFGRQTYRAPTGGACVFACSLLHEALPVTRGARYAFLPFLYDEASAARREAGSALYADPALRYRRTTSPDPAEGHGARAAAGAASRPAEPAQGTSGVPGGS
jgi:predicted 2-oxoglutarate/Fe(II)-dependent dioxygenase YbiX/peroxiredoxin